VDKPSRTTLFFSFLKLGLTAFGGPAMVAYIREMSVERKQWLSDESFRDGVALCQSIPGATAMQTAAYVGLETRGITGALSAYIGFGLPAFFLMLALSTLYMGKPFHAVGHITLQRAPGDRHGHNCPCRLFLRTGNCS
jgi:chromate transporter